MKEIDALAIMKKIDELIIVIMVIAVIAAIASYAYYHMSRLDKAVEIESHRMESWRICDEHGKKGKAFIGPDGLPWCTVYEWDKSK